MSGVSIPNISISAVVLSMIKKGEPRQTIVSKLVAEGQEEYFVKQLVEEVYRTHVNKMRSQGLMYILAGAVVCLGSCIATITIADSGNLPFFLYGLTTIGIIIAFVGLTKVF